jgi:hypothetical protein
LTYILEVIILHSLRVANKRKKIKGENVRKEDERERRRRGRGKVGEGKRKNADSAAKDQFRPRTSSEIFGLPFIIFILRLSD